MMRRYSSSELLVAACFLASGFAALIYQTVWASEFGFAFGTTEIAVATVLAGYMAGLAAGSAAIGRFGGRIERPILAYAILELGIAASALAMPWAIQGAESLLVAVYGHQAEIPAELPTSVTLFYLASSFLALMVPTSLMGATLPLLVRQVVRGNDQVGPVVSALYALNTLGAVAGTVVAAFLLLPALGLRSTVYVAVAVNAVVFVLAAVASRISPSVHVQETGRKTALWSWILPIMTLSGSVSFTYEVLWTRLLAHKLGGSVYAFATMLAAFLLGIALGSSLAGRFARARARAIQAFAYAQAGIALAAWGALRFADELPGIQTGAGATPAAALLCVAVMLPTSLAIGCTFPLAVRILARDESEASRASARVYAWNTLGSILGALGATWFLLPALGFANTVLLCVVVSVALGVAVAGRRRPLALLTCGLVLVTALVFRPQEPLRLIATSAFERSLGTRDDGGKRGDASMFRYSVGRSATVVVAQAGPGMWRIWTNGLPESLIYEEPVAWSWDRTVHWLGSLPALVRPETTSIAAVGLGGGTHLELVPRTVNRIDVVELEREVIVANERLSDRRRLDPLADPRVHVHENDARNAFLLTGRKWGGIVAQASHPWTASAAHLYSKEFFELSRSRLEEGGVFVQWMGPNFVDGELLRSIIATMREVWEHVRVYQPPAGGALLFVASDRPFAPADEAIRTLRAADPETMDRLGLLSPAHLEAGILLDEEGASTFSAGAPVITDDRNLLQMRSPGVFRGGTSLIAKTPTLPDPLAAMEPRERDRVLAVLCAFGNTGRVNPALRSLDVDRARFRGLGNVGAANPLTGVRDLLTSLSRSPEDRETRAALLAWSFESNSVPKQDAWSLITSPELQSPVERLVALGFEAARADDWQSLAALDGRLASVAVDDPFFRSAALLRATWRVELGEPPRLREAERVLLPLLWSRSNPNRARLLFARAAWALGEKRRAAAALDALMRGGAALGRSSRSEIDALLDAVLADPRLEVWHEPLGKARRSLRWVGSEDAERQA